MRASPSSDFTAHLALGTTTLAWLVEITRRDGGSVALTTHDADLVVEGTSYLAADGFAPSSVAQAADLSVDGLELSGLVAAGLVSAEDLDAGLYDGAAVTMALCNWADPTQGRMVMSKGWIGEVRRDDVGWRAELRALQSKLQTDLGRYYQLECDAEFGDARCGYDAASTEVSGTLTGATDGRVFIDSGRGEATGYFDRGVLTWTAGANAGLSAEVKEFVSGGTIRLFLPMGRAVAIGDEYTLRRGCDKRATTCQAYSNFVNFRGFPSIPGPQALLTRPPAPPQG